MSSIRVASFNIRTSRGMDGRNHWLLRRRATYAAIRGLGADVTGLQEVRPGQLADLRRAFADDALVGAGRDAGGGGEHAAVLVAADWQVESTETRWLSPTPDRPGSRGWGAEHPRVATLVRVRRGPVRIGVANTHFDHSRALARERSAELLVRWLGAEPDVPWVITGDLNAEPDDRPARTLIDSGWVDALAGAPGGTEHAFTGATDRTRIDFVLAGPGLTATSTGIDHTRPNGRLPSDHWPVVADLRVD